MKVVALETVKLTLSEVAKMAKNGPVILTRKGKPLAAVKDLGRVDWDSISLANNPRFLALIEESRRAFQEEGGIRLEELRQELKLSRKRRRQAKKV
jgi:hypothetical protein